MPERDIRSELKKRVEAYGGEIRAVAWLGRAHAPDVLALFPVDSLYATMLIRTAAFRAQDLHPFVETKAEGGKPNGGQLREHKRMRQAQCTVLVVSTFGQLDAWLPPR